MKRVLTCFALLIVAATPSFSQQDTIPPDTLWTRIYQVGPGRDEMKSVVRTLDGGYMLFGQSHPEDRANDFYMIKLDSEGETEWSRNHYWLNQSIAYSGAATLDGGYVMVGIVDGAFCAKFDSAGNEQWAIDYGNGSGVMDGVTVNSSGDIIGVGNIGSANAGVIAIDDSGEVTWRNEFGGGGIDYFQKALETSDGGYLLIGASDSFGDYRNGYLVKTDSVGQEEWSNNYDVGGVTHFRTGLEIPDSGYIIAGGKRVGESRDAAVFRVATDGELLWSQSYFDSRGQGFPDIIASPNGGFLCVGEDDDYQYRALKIDDDGNVLWELDIGDQRSSAFISVVLTDEGGYFIAGHQYPRIHRYEGFIDYWVVCTAPDTARIPNDVVLLDPAFPSDLILHNPYPNPFNSTTNIAYDLKSDCDVCLSVFDLQGREVTRLVNQRQEAGKYSMVWNAAGVPSGVYLLQFKTSEGESFEMNRKVVLMK